MESLKEFIYYDVNGNQIKNPDHTLQYDKKDDKLLWFDAKNSPAENPKWWVRAENTEEQRQLNKALERGTIAENQIATTGWLEQKKKEAAEAAQNKPGISPKSTGNNFDPAESKPSPKEPAETLIVNNLVNSGILQKEVNKAVINTENIPIFSEDIPRISAAIAKALKAATKSGLFDDEFLVSEGEVANTGRAMNATADTVMRTVLDTYLSSSKSPDNKNVFVYTVLPEEPLQEKVKKKEFPHVREAASSLREENTTPDPVNATPDPVNTTPKDPAKPPVDEPPAQKPETIVVPKQRKRDLEAALSNKITEMLSNVLETIKSTATSVRFYCTYARKPLQTETEEPKKESAPQEGTGKTGEDSAPQEETEKLGGDDASQVEVASEENKGSGKTEEALHSNDYYVFTRLVEAEDDGKTGTEGNTESNKDPKTGEDPIKETDKEKEKPKEEQSEAPAFPTTEALKTFIEGLNRSGKSFETNLAVYTLSYTLEDMDTDSSSFNILVESKKTTPKEGFWESLGKKLKAHLKKAGAQIADALGGGRGQMD